MRAVQWSLVLVFAVLAAGIAIWAGYGAENGQNGNGLAMGITRFVSKEMRRGEARQRKLDTALARLPELQPAPFASRYGFRSNTLQLEQTPHWVQFDLGRRRSIDRVVAVPVHIPSLGSRGKGYGFPRRFKIEVGDDREMKDGMVVVNRSGADVPNPGMYPVIFNINPVEGRYVRFTSTRHFHTEDGFIWALEELMLLSGNNNVGVGTAITTTNSLELYPNWSKMRINDGLSSLGMPVANQKSPTSGYASALSGKSDSRMILAVDLGREYPIDEIRLLPVESSGFEVPGSLSFPRVFMVEIALDSEFVDPFHFTRRTTVHVPGYPGSCAFVVQGGGGTARYVRLVTEHLWGADDLNGFGVSEVQVYSGGRNVALGKQVMATSISDRDDASRWSPSFAVDGYNTRHRLIEYPEYLDMIGMRDKYERERERIVSRQTSMVRRVERTLSYGSMSLGLVVLLGGGWIFARQKRMSAETVKRMREQIARDLHDDIGSNLGGIVLLSDMGARNSNDKLARQDFLTIREAAEQTSQSMQDIVWLIERGQTGIEGLIERMRRSIAVILGEEVASISVSPDDFRDQTLTLFFLRHFFLAFKETLNNVRKHAAASLVRVSVRIEAHGMSFEVEDNGVGFDPDQTPGTGHGLTNLRRRAGRLGGEFRVESRRGSGTRIFFKAPINSIPS